MSGELDYKEMWTDLKERLERRVDNMANFNTGRRAAYEDVLLLMEDLCES